MFSLSEKVKVLDIRKKLYADFAKIYDVNQPSTWEIVGKKNCANFAAAPQNEKVMATVYINT